MTESQVVFSRCGRAGLVTLNRPRSLNALTLSMVQDIDRQLRCWADDSSVQQIVVTASGDKAFSAGGDIVQLYQWGRAGDQKFLQFYAQEYRLNTLIKRYPKPYISLINGIVMGGGVGISINGSHRVVTENVTFAMPETGIGLFPDVGGTWFLPRCPGETGMYLGLTGARLKAADTLFAGLATHFVSSQKLPELINVLCETDDIEGSLNSFARPAVGQSRLEKDFKHINDHFGAENLDTIIESLSVDTSSWAQKTYTSLLKKSPTSLAITFQQLQRGRTLSFEQCMQLEYRMVNRIFSGHDFFEGTRAVVIDKDNDPHWNPPSLADISKGDIDAYFAPLEKELDLQ